VAETLLHHMPFPSLLVMLVNALAKGCITPWTLGCTFASQGVMLGCQGITLHAMTNAAPQQCIGSCGIHDLLSKAF
jgi:hypothetical protein